MKVGYLGPRGTFSEQAAITLAKGNELVPYHSFLDALKAVANDEVQEAVVPIENSIEGIIANMPNADTETKASTAGAIQAVAESGYGVAGIGAKCAAEFYGLEVIAEGIQDTNDNFTEFARVSKRKTTEYKKDNFVTIVFSTSNEPGALLKILDIFSIYDINMSKIYSRPLRNKPL